LDGVAAMDEVLAGDGLVSGVGVTGGGLVSAGAANPFVINEKKTTETTSVNIVVARGRPWIMS